MIINIFKFKSMLNHISNLYNIFNDLKYIKNLFNIEIFCNLINFIFCILIEENKENIVNSDILLDKFIGITENFVSFINIIKNI